jgi:alcohol dehydrogenase
MRALVYDQFGSPPAVRDVPEPACPVDGAVVRVKATGLCRSDWHGWMGHDPDIRILPHVPGHEFAGTIEALGPDVAGWRIGDRVTAPFVMACGRCPLCMGGDGQVCDEQQQPGFTYWGSFADLVVVPRATVNLVRLPDELDFTAAASLGCRFATAYRAIVSQGRLSAGEWLAVHGAGGIGLSAVMIGVAVGAAVVAVDISPAARGRARELGAEFVIDPATTDVVTAITRASGGGADVSIDALGSAQTCRDSIACLRKRGRHIQVGLLAADDADPPIAMGSVIARELELRGSHGMAAHEYPAMLRRIVDGTLRPQRLVGRTIGLDDAPAALVAMGQPSIAAGLTIIVPQGGHQ